ncbi:MAG TPA: SDR family oxidoreductase [Dongiaceae bacterium]|nr:SDR family oxidoreductase [Dongiaceae bacterium]
MTSPVELAPALPFADQPVLITGASTGIGFACAQVLVDAGARHLILTARNGERLAAAQAQLQANATVHVDTLVCDHTQRDDLDHLLMHLDELGWPGTLIANVGVNPVHEYGPKKMHSLSFEQIQSAVTTNITHTFYLLGTTLKAMRSERRGRILLVGSQGWRHGIPGQALYNLSKSSLAGLKNSVVGEYGGSGIFCHLLNPGLVLNERTLRLRQNNPQLAAQKGVTEMDVAQAALQLLLIDDLAENGRERDI